MIKEDGRERAQWCHETPTSAVTVARPPVAPTSHLQREPTARVRRSSDSETDDTPFHLFRQRWGGDVTILFQPDPREESVERATCTAIFGISESDVTQGGRDTTFGGGT